MTNEELLAFGKVLFDLKQNQAKFRELFGDPNGLKLYYLYTLDKTFPSLQLTKNCDLRKILRETLQDMYLRLTSESTANYNLQKSKNGFGPKPQTTIEEVAKYFGR